MIIWTVNGQSLRIPCFTRAILTPVLLVECPLQLVVIFDPITPHFESIVPLKNLCPTWLYLHKLAEAFQGAFDRVFPNRTKDFWFIRGSVFTVSSRKKAVNKSTEKNAMAAES